MKGTQFDEDYATPGFDSGTEAVYRGLEYLHQQWGQQISFTVSDFIRAGNADVLEDGSVKTTAYFFVRAYRAKRLSADPDDPIEERWGIPFLRDLVRELPGKAAAEQAEIIRLEQLIEAERAEVLRQLGVVNAIESLEPPSGLGWIAYYWNSIFGKAPTESERLLAALTPEGMAQRKTQALAARAEAEARIEVRRREVAEATSKVQASRDELVALRRLGY